jgi:hypothetical protein
MTCQGDDLPTRIQGVATRAMSQSLQLRLCRDSASMMLQENATEFDLESRKITASSRSAPSSLYGHFTGSLPWHSAAPRHIVLSKLAKEDYFQAQLGECPSLRLGIASIESGCDCLIWFIVADVGS